MKFRILLSSLLHLLAFSSAALADVSNNVPTSVSGGSGAVGAIQTDDGTFYNAARGDTVNIGGFTAVGGDISSVVLHVKFSVDSGGYGGNNPIRVNGINTSIIPASGDTQRTASVDITAGSFRVNTWPEITALAVSFINNDGGSGQSVLFDHAYLVITHTTPLFAPPTWSDEFDDSGPPNPAVWTFEQGFVRNEELQWYQSNNAWQENGNLIIEGRREQVPNPNYVAGSSDWRENRQFAQYTSSSIVSQGKYSFQYGRMQVRAKIPCFPGAWPAIWTLGNSGEWPSNGECDVLEYYATDSVLANCARGSTTRWSATWDAVKKPVSPFFTATNPNPNWRTEYHIWTMQWDQDNVRLYIDNHLMNTTAQSWLVNPVTTWGPQYPFKQPHFLLLNLALGGAGGSPSGTTFPLRYELDHVRVWEGLTGNNAPTDITLSSNSMPEGLPIGTVVGNLTATDVDAAEVHGFSLVAGAGDTHNSSFEVVFKSDQTKTSVLRTKAVLSSAGGTTRSIRVRVTDIEGATYDKILTIQLSGQYVIEVAPAALSISEGGNNTFDVRLRVAPTSNVTVNVSRLSGDADLNVASGSPLVFTPANGTTWQTVTLSAAEDADRINGTATILCNDPSGVFLNATVLATEADNEPPPIQAVVVLSNMNQTFDGFMKSVTVTTTVGGVPQNLSYDLTYGGQFMNPTDAGEYEVIATITDPDYAGSSSGTLVIAKAAQTINFAALGTVLDTSAPIPLTATASSSLPVSYASSNTNAAVLSGSNLIIAGPGSTNIMATQAGNNNYNAATAVTQTLTVVRANPLAVTTGPYLVLSNQTLSLNGAGSQPSEGQTISSYSWDLNNDTTFGDVTGATPAAISFATLITTWGMVDGLNPITLQVTDSAGKISTVSTTVEVVVSSTWDSNGNGVLQTDGAGDWTASNQWWNGSGNTNWTSGDDAIFGNSGTGGAVSLASPTTANSLTFNSFTGTYTLGTSGQTITLNNGIIKNAASGAVTIVSPLALGAAQSWTNGSAGLLTIGPDAVSNGGFLLSVGGTGNTTVSGAIGGAGGLSKSGAGTLSLSSTSGYGGATTVSGGTLALSNANTISAGTSVAATATLRLGHATSMGTSTMTLASGATLQLRNDANTIFIAPIATAPTTAVIYNFDVNNAGSAETNKTLSLGNLTFATSTTGSVTNQINITGGNGYILGLGTISAPSSGGSLHPVIINATTAAITIAKFSAGSYGHALQIQGGNAITLTNFEMGSNGNNSLTVSGSGTVVNLGASSQTNNRAGGTATFTMTSGKLNINNALSISNPRASGGPIAATAFNINGGTLDNTSGAAITQTVNSPITIGGNFAFGTVSSTSANNLNLGAGAVTLGGTTRTITTNGAAALTLGGVISNGGIIKAGSGTLALGGQNTFIGNTTVSSGTLVINSTGGVYTVAYTAAPTVTVSSGATLQLAAWAYGPNGGLKFLDVAAARLLVNGGTITYTGNGEGEGNQNNGRLFTIGTGGATLNAAGTGTWFIEPYADYDLTTGQAISNGLNLTLTGASNGRYNKRISGPGSLIKYGAGTWTLGGANTYSGATYINGGALVITGATQSTSAISFTDNSSLGLMIGSPVTAANAVVNFTNGRVSVTGTPSAASHILLTASSFEGAPLLASPVPGYALQVVGNQLQLNQIVTNPYDLWKIQITNGQNARNQDADGDGFSNLHEFLFGTSPIAGNGSLVTTTPASGNLDLRWLQRESGATYTLKQSATLAAGSWTSVGLPIPAPEVDQNGTPANYDRYEVTLPTSADKIFFRIEGVEN